MIFTPAELAKYKQRLQHQKDILPVAFMFSEEQKKELDEIYARQLLICDEAAAKWMEVREPISVSNGH